MSASNVWRWRARQALPYLLLLVCIAVGAGVVKLVSVVGDWDPESPFRDDSGTSVAPADPSIPVEVSDKSSQVPVAEQEKRNALAALQGFVTAYYGRTPQLYEGTAAQTLAKHRQSVAPYATKNFVSENVTPLDAGADLALEENGIVVEASLVRKSMVGHFDDGKEAEADFRIRLQLVRTDGTVQKHHADVFVTLVKTSGTWRVNTLEELM